VSSGTDVRSAKATDEAAGDPVHEEEAEDGESKVLPFPNSLSLN